MKRLLFVAVALATSLVYGNTYHIKHAYIMKKDKDNKPYILRIYIYIYIDGKYHDWYVNATNNPWLFYGYESNDEIIVDTLTDIGIKSEY